MNVKMIDIEYKKKLFQLFFTKVPQRNLFSNKLLSKLRSLQSQKTQIDSMEKSEANSFTCNIVTLSLPSKN